MTGDERPCCAPPTPATARPTTQEAQGPTASSQPVRLSTHPSSSARHSVEQVHIDEWSFMMGDHHGDGHAADGETPVHPVHLSAFSIDATSVTNADFARFVGDTDYRTDAERFGFSAVFHLAVEADATALTGTAPGAPWWLGVRGADWRHPGGPDSSIENLDHHPVVHVSWNDAQAYCQWAERRLPTEAEWELASRAGAEGARYPWGDHLLGDDESAWPCNIWQGTFPSSNTMADGYLTTAPVRSYRPNRWGLWQTVGNVWEWCSDWFNPRTYELDHRKGPVSDPKGPAFGMAKVMRGGSYLCHDSYCNRYRNAARTSNTPDSSMANTGFRTVARA